MCEHTASRSKRHEFNYSHHLAIPLYFFDWGGWQDGGVNRIFGVDRSNLCASAHLNPFEWQREYWRDAGGPGR